MTQKFKDKLNFYQIVLRVWCFLILSVVVIAIVFPVRIPLCGTGGEADGAELSGKSFAQLLGVNALLGLIILRMRSILLFLLIAAGGIVVISLGSSWLFSIPHRF